MQGEHAVVTGGAGFIGSHLCEALLEAGHRVTVLDDFSSGQLANLEALRARFSQRLFVRRGDVRDSAAVAEALEGADWVFHLAALTSVEESIRQPRQVQAVNLDGTLNVLEAARQAGVGRLIFASSTSVYGVQPCEQQEEAGPVLPASPYALTKLACEHFCRLHSDLYGLSTASLRYFNVYGPRQSPDSPYAAVIPRFIQAFTRGRAPTIFGDGRQTRDFIYVEDVIRANLLAARAAVRGGCFNVATGHSRSVLEVAQVIARLGGFPPQVEYAPARKGEVRHSRGATQQAFQDLGFRAEVSLEEGLSRTLKWFSEQSSVSE